MPLAGVHGLFHAGHRRNGRIKQTEDKEPNEIGGREVGKWDDVMWDGWMLARQRSNSGMAEHLATQGRYRDVLSDSHNPIVTIGSYQVPQPNSGYQKV